MTIEPAAPGDAAAILVLQRLAYQSEAELYQDWSLPPLLETVEQIQAAIARQTVLKAWTDEPSQPIGSVRGLVEDGTCHIGRLIVHPEQQGRGIGTSLLGAIEDCFPDAARFELFTGHKSERNLRLYRRLGFVAFREQRVSEGLTLIWLEKRGREGLPGAR
jgi:ribosomal protein S18 acetylase RimI-like enzyme